MAIRPSRAKSVPARNTIDGTEILGVALTNGSEGSLTIAQIISAIAAANLNPSLSTPPTASRTYQRDTTTGGAFSKGIGAVGLTLTLAGAAATAEYRLRDNANPTTALVDWTQFATGLTTGANALSVNFPASQYRYLLDVRVNGYSGNIASATQPFGVGEITMAFGQSLCSVMFYMVGGGTGTNATAGITPSTTGTTLAKNGSGPVDGWGLSGDATPFVSVFVSQFVNMMEASTGVVCSLSGRAIGATAISAFVGPESGMSTIMSSVGKWRTTIWCHGHSDGNTAQATYLSSLNTLMGQIDAANSWAGTKLKVLMPPPNINTNWGANIYMIRAAMAQYVAANPSTSVLCIAPDIKLIDGTHPDNVLTGGARHAAHAARAVKGLLGLDANGDKGPTVLTVTRAAGTKVFTFTVQHAGGTALSTLGSAHLNFQFYPTGTIATTLTPPIAGSLTPTALNVVDATHFTVTVSDTLTDGQGFDVYNGWPYVPTDGSITGVWDNNTADGYTLGRALTVNTAPVACAAPNASATPGTPSISVGSATSSSLTLSLTDSTGGTPSYYTVQRSTASDFSANLVTLNSGVISYTGTTTTYVDSAGLSASTAYYYRATATNGNGTSSQSAGFTGSTTSASVAPGNVTSLAAGTPTSSTIPVTYTAPSTGTAPITYAGQTSLDNSTWTANSGTFTATGGSFTGLAASTPYYVRIIATNAFGSSTTVYGSPSTVSTTALTYPAMAGTTNVLIADPAVGVTTDGSGNVTAVANQATSGASNNLKNGNGNVLVGANTFGTGKPGFLFTGSNNLIHNTGDTWMNALGASSVTLLVVLQSNFASNGNLVNWNVGNSTSAYGGLACDTSGVAIKFIHNPTGSGEVIQKNVSGAATTANTHRVVARFDKTAGKLDMWVDGVQVTPSVTGTTTSISGTVGNFVLGTFTTTGGFGGNTTNVGFLQVITGAASDTDITNIAIPYLAAR